MVALMCIVGLDNNQQQSFSRSSLSMDASSEVSTSALDGCWVLDWRRVMKCLISEGTARKYKHADSYCLACTVGFSLGGVETVREYLNVDG